MDDDLVIYQNLATGGISLPGNDLNHLALAVAGDARDADDFARVNCQADAMKGLEAVVAGGSQTIDP